MLEAMPRYFTRSLPTCIDELSYCLGVVYCRATLQVAANGTAAAKSGVLGSFVNRLSMRVVGKESLSSEDLAPALEDMKRRLMERNVAEEIAVQVCNSVAQSLEGKKLSSFTGV